VATKKLQQARTLRKTLTPAERKLWQWIRQRQLEGFKFRRQVPLGVYIVDFLCYEAKVIIEIDGGGHNEENSQLYDAARTYWLERQGFIVKRFWNNEITENIAGVWEEIVAICHQRKI
jgi:very-short-patch-repair endonuclease